jgi:hypothetical protein
MESTNSIVHKEDQKDFDLEIKPDWKNGKQLNIFCSFTYITPNYSILFTLNELKKFVIQGNYRVFLVIWDMNTLANPYFKRMITSRKVMNPDSFIDQRVTELRDLAESIGFDKEKISIYKSSDLWKRMIAYNEENIFQQFYTVLAKMNIGDFVDNKKVSHLFQVPMDIFFCNYFHKLYPEDTSKAIDLAFFGQDKESLYLATRKHMIEEGLIDNKKPIFLLMKYFPYLLYNHNLPEWDMSLKDIKNIVINSPIDKKEILDLLRHIAGSINISVKDSDEELDFKDFYESHKDKSEKELKEILAENLYRYLKEHRKKFIETSGRIEESILHVTKKSDVKNIGKVLKSQIALDILILADGSKSTTEISKEINKSVATISTYANRLKRMNLIRVLENGNLKRNIKGVKVNFELGL